MGYYVIALMCVMVVNFTHEMCGHVITARLVNCFKICPHMSCRGAIQYMEFVAFFDLLTYYLTCAFVIKNPNFVIIQIVDLIWA